MDRTFVAMSFLVLVAASVVQSSSAAVEQSYVDLSDEELFAFQGGRRIGECYVGLGGPSTACKYYVKAKKSTKTSYNGWPRTTSDLGTGCVKSTAGSFCYFKSSSYPLTNEERKSMCAENAAVANAAAQLRHAIRNGACGYIPYDAETQKALDMSDEELFKHQGGNKLGEHCYIGKGSSTTACNYYVKAQTSPKTGYNGWPRTTDDKGTGCVKESDTSFCYFSSLSYKLTDEERKSMCQPKAAVSNAAAQLRHALRNGACGSLSSPSCKQEAVFFHDCEKEAPFLKGNTWSDWAGNAITGDLGGFLQEDFQSARSGQSGFAYRVDGLAEGTTYSITLGFAEGHEPNCAPGKRVLNVHVNGEEFESGIDVFEKSGGCHTALVLTKDFTLSKSTAFEIVFTSSVENPMISLIEVRESCPSSTSTQTNTPVALPTDAPVYPPTGAPVALLTDAPTVSPTGSPVASPVISPYLCAPTSGSCASTEADLQSQVDGASAGDVVSVCSGATLLTSAPVTIETNSLTLCCAGNSEEDCIMKSDGTDRVLVVSGEHFTVESIEFRGGNSNGAYGGNVFIDAPGDHRISKCKFFEGVGGFYGGNLSVDPSPNWSSSNREEGSITIDQSYFSGGTATGAGGNAFITSAGTITVTDSAFVGGVAYGWGPGGIMVASSYGSMPSLAILRSVFEDNNGDKGAAATIFSPNTAVTLSGLSGSGNTGTSCSGIQIQSNECVVLGDAYPPGTTNPPVAAPSPSPQSPPSPSCELPPDPISCYYDESMNVHFEPYLNIPGTSAQYRAICNRIKTVSTSGPFWAHPRFFYNQDFPFWFKNDCGVSASITCDNRGDFGFISGPGC